MRVLGVLAAWGVLAVLATMCFALGGSLGYRRGVRDTLNQIRERRTGNAGCRPLPANHLRRRTSGHARPGARARRARWRPRHAGASVVGPTRAAVPVRSRPRVAALAAMVAAILLIGVPGAAIAATTAQPGESLYTVRRGLENVRVALARGADANAEVHVELARARLIDLQGLVGDDTAPEVVTDVSRNLGDHANAAASQLTAVADRARLGALLERVTSEQVEVMNQLVRVDCMGADDVSCRAFHDARDSTKALRHTTKHDVAVSDPLETAVRADQDVVTAEEKVEGQIADEARTAPDTNKQDDGGAEPTNRGTGDDISSVAAADAAAATDPPEDGSTSAAQSTNDAPSPSASETPTANQTPPAGSPATEPSAPTGDQDAPESSEDSATEGSGQ